MSLNFNPYFTFTGQGRQALEFYRDVFGGEISIKTFNDFQAPVEDQYKDLVMHGELRSDHLTLRVSDGAALSGTTQRASTNMEASITGSLDQLELAQGWFDKLSQGASKIHPLAPAPWGDHFGSFTDRYGIAWMFNFGAEN